jgi:hypothetical protein
LSTNEAALTFALGQLQFVGVIEVASAEHTEEDTHSAEDYKRVVGWAEE